MTPSSDDLPTTPAKVDSPAEKLNASQEGWTTVQSSNVARVRYDDARQVLQVKFLTGSLWEYAAVSRNTFDDLLGARSVGKFLNSHIKGKHVESKVS